MRRLTPEQAAAVCERFFPERPGPLVGPHVVTTGLGSIRVDRWPDPRAALAESGGNFSLAGDPGVIEPDELRERLRGFVDAPPAWRPRLEALFPGMQHWARVILRRATATPVMVPKEYSVRRLNGSDAATVEGLSPALRWISKTWGGPDGLATSGYAWGAFGESRLVSVACSFFVGRTLEDLGVVTEPAFEGRGIATACAGRLCAEVEARGRRASWTTTPDNHASLRVAEKMGFKEVRHDWLYVIGVQTA